MIKDQIIDLLQKALTKLDLTIDGIYISKPSQESFGDYSSSIALQLAKQEKKNPLELAQQIVDALPPSEFIEKVDVVKPGFINFWLSQQYLLDNLLQITANNTYGSSQTLQKPKVILEYTDPNPFKEMHIGHLYSNTIGESLSRLYESQGAEVKRANYQGDVGMHVAKSIWGLQKKMEGESITLKDLEKLTLSDRIKYLGQAYAKGATAYEEDNNAAQQIKNINYLVYSSAQDRLHEQEGWEPQVDYKQYIEGKGWNQEIVKDLYYHGRQWSLDYFETIYKKLGTTFDYYFFESTVGEYGVKIVKEYTKKGIFQESNGAIIFKGEDFGVHTRVFINSLGLPTYEAKELGLAPTKYKLFPYDHSFIITGNEIKEYFKVLLTALKQIEPELANKTVHITHGMVRLPEGKMSSRTGKVLTAEWLIHEVETKIRGLVSESTKVHKEEIEEVSEILTIAAIKYSFLKNSVGKDIAFDFNESLSLEGNSGPYLEYTFARCKSVLSIQKVQDEIHGITGVVNLNDDEMSLVRHLAKFPEVVTEATLNFAPHLICNYLFELAQKYNLFYHNNPILKSKGDQKILRLLITEATGKVLQKGLHLLGIKTVEKM